MRFPFSLFTASQFLSRGISVKNSLQIFAHHHHSITDTRSFPKTAQKGSKKPVFSRLSEHQHPLQNRVPRVRVLLPLPKIPDTGFRCLGFFRLRIYCFGLFTRGWKQVLVLLSTALALESGQSIRRAAAYPPGKVVRLQKVLPLLLPQRIYYKLDTYCPLYKSFCGTFCSS